MNTLRISLFLLALALCLATIYAIQPFESIQSKTKPLELSMDHIVIHHKNIQPNFSLFLDGNHLRHNPTTRTTHITPIHAQAHMDNDQWEFSADEAIDRPNTLTLKGHVIAFNHDKPCPIQFKTEKLIIDKQSLTVQAPEPLASIYQSIISYADSGQFNLRTQDIRLNHNINQFQRDACPTLEDLPTNPKSTGKTHE